MQTKLTIGSDPEFMIAQEGRITCAIPVLEHSKYDRIPLTPDKMDTIYYDGAMAECTIRPSYSTEETVENFRQLVTKAANLLAAKRAKILATASHTFEDKDLTHEDARQAGCNPEMCAYEISMVDPPVLQQTNFRSAGGHIHIGRVDADNPATTFLTQDNNSLIAVVRAMDYYVGVAFTYLENDPSAIARKELYGRAGRHRPTQYGVEYRVLSNYWVSHPKLVAFADKLTRFAVGKAEENQDIWQNIENKDVIDIINSGSVENALSFAEANFPAEFVAEMRELKNIAYNPDLVTNYQ